MASSRPKTTMNKLNRERKVREKRIDKEARKLARANADPAADVQLDDVQFDDVQLENHIGESAESK